MKKATVYKRDGKWYIHSDCKTTAGVWIASAPFAVLDNDPLRIGESILQALAASTIDVPHPTEWNHIFSPILELAGAKSWASFVKGASLIGIKMNDESIAFTPYRNEGASEGFDPILQKTVTIPSASTAKQIGAALEEAFTRCE